MIFTTHHLRLSPALGYVLAGILVGPYGFSLVKDAQSIHLLGEAGVLFLLFKVGLELPFHRLRALRTYIFGLGLLQVLLTALSFSVILFYGWDFSLTKAFFVGSVLSLSSTALIIQLLTERGELSSRFGRTSFSVLLFQDLSVIFLFLFVTLRMTTSQEGLFDSTLLWVVAKTFGGMFVLVMIARFMVQWVFHFLVATGYTDLFTASIVLSCLGIAYGAVYIGLPSELGAFVAGICLSDTRYCHKIESEIKIFQGLLLGLFFMLIGFQVNLKLFFNEFLLFASLLLCCVGVKTFILFFLARFFGFLWGQALHMGLLLGGCGEFVFIIFSNEKTQEWVGRGVVDVLFTLTAFSMVLTPFFSVLGAYFAKKGLPSLVLQKTLPYLVPTPPLKNHVIIAGFGSSGKIVGDILSQNMVSCIAVDYDMERIRQARKDPPEHPVMHGDIRSHELLKKLSIQKARILVITFSQITKGLDIIQHIQEHHPHLEICVGVVDSNHSIHKLLNTGVHLVSCQDTQSTAVQLAAVALQIAGFSSEHVEKVFSLYSYGKKESLVLEKA